MKFTKILFSENLELYGNFHVLKLDSNTEVFVSCKYGLNLHFDLHLKSISFPPLVVFCFSTHFFICKLKVSISRASFNIMSLDSSPPVFHHCLMLPHMKTYDPKETL